MPGRRHRGAFALIELLVAIATVVLLVSILLPSLRKAREAAERVKCRAHLHSLARNTHLYVTESGPSGRAAGTPPRGSRHLPPLRVAPSVHGFQRASGMARAAARLLADLRMSLREHLNCSVLTAQRPRAERETCDRSVRGGGTVGDQLACTKACSCHLFHGDRGVISGSRWCRGEARPPARTGPLPCGSARPVQIRRTAEAGAFCGRNRRSWGIPSGRSTGILRKKRSASSEKEGMSSGWRWTELPSR